MLIGRDLELRRLAGLIEAAKGGASGALVLRGEPGIGKSALLAYALERAAGLQTIVCRPVESESEIPFSGLGELLSSKLNRLDAVPHRQAEALRGVLALGPPVAGDRFAVYAATLSLLAAVAENGPLVVAVDDAQWLDLASAEALLFTARRLGAEGIAMVISLRTSHPSVLDSSGLEEVCIGGLGDTDTGRLLAGRGLHVAEGVARGLCRATAGNPLAVLEIAALLSDGQLRGIEPLGDPLPAGASVERAYLRRVAGLHAEVRRALVVASAADSEDMAPVAAALRAMGIDAAVLGEAEDRGLVHLGGHRIVFAHPLIRSCVYHAATPSEQRAAHRALAAALQTQAQSADADRAAWHLAAAAVEPDEDVAGALEDVAIRARERSGYAAAGRAFERAAELSPRAHDRARRLLEAAEASLFGGPAPRAKRQLEEAMETATDPLLLARIQHMRGRTEMVHGRPEAAFHTLTRDALKFKASDPMTACRMLVDATMTCAMRGDIEAAVSTGERAWTAAQNLPGSAKVAALAVYAHALMLDAQVSRVADLLPGDMESLEAFASAGRDPWIPSQAMVVLVWMERYDEALQLSEVVVNTAREESAIGFLPLALAVRTEMEVDLGDWNSAYAHALEAIDLARTTGQDNVLSYCLVTAARLEAFKGLAKVCLQHAEEARVMVGSLGSESVGTFARAAMGALHLALGRYQQALGPLLEVSRLMAEFRVHHPSVVRWAPDLVDALAHLGSTDEAWRVLETFEAKAERVGTPWARATASRCRGILVADDYDTHFETALETHQRDVLPFERARTELAYGERLRRSRRRGDARPHLREALETFERLGAVP